MSRPSRSRRQQKANPMKHRDSMIANRKIDGEAAVTDLLRRRARARRWADQRKANDEKRLRRID